METRCCSFGHTDTKTSPDIVLTSFDKILPILRKMELALKKIIKLNEHEAKSKPSRHHERM